MEDLKKKIIDWVEKHEFDKKSEETKKHLSLIRKRKEELESIKTKMSETIY
jgi:hypothetical protein